MSDKVPFTVVENKVIVQITFNSSLFCKCQTSCKYEIGRPEFVFKYRIDDNDHEMSYVSIIKNNDAIINDFVLQANFKYYDNHIFHKLIKNLHQTNDFSLFHTNICSLNGNLENLQTLISNLEISFSVIAASETWTPKGKSNVKPRKLEGYQNYLRNRGSSLRMVVVSILRKVLSLNHEKILILLVMIQIINFNLLGLKSFMVTNIIIGVYYRHPKKTQITYFLKI